MTKFAKFTDALGTPEGRFNQEVYVNPAFVRVVSAQPSGGTLIQLDGQQISVTEDVAAVLSGLYS